MGFYRFSSPGNSCCPNAWVNFRVYRASDLAEVDNGNVFGKNVTTSYGGVGGAGGVVEVCQLGSSLVAALGRSINGFGTFDYSVVGLDSSFDVDWTVSLATAKQARNLTHVGGDVCIVREKSGSSQWEIACLDEADGSDVWTYENTGVNDSGSPNGLWYDATNALVLVAHTGYTRSSDSLQVNVTALNVADGSEAWQIRIGGLVGIPSVPIVFDLAVFDGTDVWTLGTGGGFGPVERWSITYPPTDGDTGGTAVSAEWSVDYSCAAANDRTTLISGPSVIYDDTPVRYVNTGAFGHDPPADLAVGQVYSIQGKSGATFLNDSPAVDITSDQASGLGARVQQYHADADDILIAGGRVYVRSQKQGDYTAGQLVRIASANDAFDLAQWWPGVTAGSLQTFRATLNGSIWACTQRPDPEEVDFLDSTLASSSQKTYQGYNADGLPLCVVAVGSNFIVGGETTRRKLLITDP